ncbi:MAG TPA: Mur ligase family protein, partial [Nannocystaceae bacterium]|nr:Mur ligase family protein [Nannocystaceae bacterium]
EWAVASATEVLAGRAPLTVDEARASVAAGLHREARLDLVELAGIADARGIPVLFDDEGFTLGLGERSHTWPLAAVPTAGDIPWGELGRIPVVAITGTNGKTTCARLLARILERSGRVTGNTSTDGITIGRTMIEAGDCTGPGAARTLLRRRELQAAVLEAARGGLLRRGFVLPWCDAALITNVSDDHLGEFGIQTVDELAAAKAIVADIVPADGRVVLSADSAPLVRMRDRFAADVVWFTLDPEQRWVREHVAKGGEGWWASPTGELVRARGSVRESFGAIAQVPLAFGGAARHNVANVLGTCAVAVGLGIEAAVIRATIREFGRDVADNPGRFERYERRGIAVLLDFAHNVEALRHQRDVITALRAGRPAGHRLVVSFGMAGDRSDDVLAALAAEIAELHPDRVILRDEEHYLRGRRPGEVPAVLRRAFTGHGVPNAAIDDADDERAAIARAFEWARPGDVLVVFTHTEREPVLPPE